MGEALRTNKTLRFVVVQSALSSVGPVGVRELAEGIASSRTLAQFHLRGKLPQKARTCLFPSWEKCDTANRKRLLQMPISMLVVRDDLQ